MANNYEKILELANANNMGLSNTIKRDFGIPLDYTSVQASYEAALTYAATNTLAYVGQPISVGDKLYIVTAESQGKYPADVAEGESQIDVFLAEVGSATEGDGATIDLKDGILTLHGFDLESTVAGMLPQVTVDGDGNKTLRWVPITSIVEGDGNTLTKLSSDSSINVEESYDAETDSYTYTLSNNYSVRAQDSSLEIIPAGTNLLSNKSVTISSEESAYSYITYTDGEYTLEINDDVIASSYTIHEYRIPANIAHKFTAYFNNAVVDLGLTLNVYNPDNSLNKSYRLNLYGLEGYPEDIELPVVTESYKVTITADNIPDTLTSGIYELGSLTLTTVSADLASINISKTCDNIITLRNDGLYAKSTEYGITSKNWDIDDGLYNAGTIYQLTKDGEAQGPEIYALSKNYVDGEFSAVRGEIQELGENIGAAFELIDTNKADKADTLAGYGITDAYTKTEVEGIVSSMTHMSTKVVDAAPSADVAELGVIYLVPASDVDAGTYLEYILVVHDDGSKTVEQIGSTKTDLSDYYNKSEANAFLADKADKTSVYTKDEIDQTVGTLNNSIDAKVAKTEYESDKATFALKSELETGLSGKVDTATLADYNTKDEVAQLLTAKADKTTTEAALAGKIETASITHTSEGVSEGVTKEGTNLKIVVDAYTKEQVYTKSETDAAITAKINSVTGGESAADVKLALEDYRDSINAEVWGESAREWTKRVTGDDGKVTVTYTPQYGTTSRVDTLESDVATLKTNVATAQSTADTAAQAVETLKTTEVKANADNIAALTTRVSNVETQASTNKTDISTLTGTVNGINTVVEGHTTKISEIEATLVTLGNKDTELDTAIKANAANIEKKADKDSVYTKDEVDAKVITSGEVVHGTADSVAIADNKITVTVDSYTKGEVDTLLANLDQTELENGIAANAADIAVLVGTDKDENGRANKSIRAIAAEEINTLINAADPEGGKTIENITKLVEYVDENAGEIAALVTATDKNTAKLAGIEEGTTVKAYVDAAIDAIPEYELPVATAEKLGGIKSATGDNKVTVAEDGTASVSSVNVNSLVQTTGDVLILNGGTAVI